MSGTEMHWRMRCVAGMFLILLGNKIRWLVCLDEIYYYYFASRAGGRVSHDALPARSSLSLVQDTILSIRYTAKVTLRKI